MFWKTQIRNLPFHQLDIQLIPMLLIFLPIVQLVEILQVENDPYAIKPIIYGKPGINYHNYIHLTHLRDLGIQPSCVQCDLARPVLPFNNYCVIAEWTNLHALVDKLGHKVS